VSLQETLPEEYLNGGGAGRGRKPLLSSYFPLDFLYYRRVSKKPKFAIKK
jgi:hypothetical protein